MKPEFTKMQGLGNSFIVLKGPASFTDGEVANYCDQHRVDGLLVVTELSGESVEMKYWNGDGSVAEMCGNGLRCVVRFAVDNKLVKPGGFSVKTDAGVLQVVWDGKDPNKIEVQVGRANLGSELVLFGHQFTLADVGNPHAVTFVANVATAPVKEIGPQVENDTHFVHKTNVEFVQVVASSKISVRTWERGVGETQACGTGMVAAAAVSVQKGLAQYPLDVEVLGGSAKVWLDDDGYSRMMGPAVLY